MSPVPFNIIVPAIKNRHCENHPVGWYRISVSDGQPLTETIRSFDDVCYDIFPKMLGVFERAWNAENGRDCSQFYSTIVYNEMPYWELLGIRYHIPQPGLKVENGHVSTYSLLPAAEVIVTKDGERVYARTRYGSQESVRTTMPL